MEGSSDVPDSWEVADLEASVTRLILSSSSHPSATSSSAPQLSDCSPALDHLAPGSVSDDVAGSVDQFLIEAIQNPRERLSVLRIEQDVEKFIKDPIQQQMEFKDLPTSYLRLAAHRVAQHYLLQSMVLLDNNLLDSSSSKIIIRKTGESRIPSIRLVDIPVNLPSENKGITKVAIKQRPQKNSTSGGNANSHGKKGNSAKSVEERKEEYNKARARIFSSNGRLESEPKGVDNNWKNPIGRVKFDEKNGLDGNEVNVNRALGDSSTSNSSSSSSSNSRIAVSRIEKEPVGMPRTNNRAILRDRDVERSDPDYDRSYDRYAQRFDPGFGFARAQYSVQPMYAPAVNYNTEFPQLGPPPRLSIPAEHQHHSLSHQNIPGGWVSPSTPTGMGYGHHPDAMMAAYNTNHVAGRPSSALYMHSAPYHHPGIPVYPHDQIHSFTQAHRQQHDASFGFARPR